VSTSQPTNSPTQHEHSGHPLHKTYQSADALDEVVSTTTVGKWIALSVVLVAFLGTLAWAFFGTIPQQTEQYGITSDPTKVREVSAPQAGTVSFAVSDGDQVKEGDTLAEVTSFNGSDTIKVSAPLAGTVSNLSGESGTGVDAGSKLLTVTGTVTDAANLSFVLFTSQEVATLYNDPESITISYTTSAGESQELPGKVTFVATSPTNPDSIAILAGGQDRLGLLTRGEDLPLHQVTVMVADDADTSATELPAVGQVVTILNRYSQPHPIELLFGDQE
jgi:biotin carboxyl carrier protein